MYATSLAHATRLRVHAVTLAATFIYKCVTCTPQKSSSRDVHTLKEDCTKQA